MNLKRILSNNTVIRKYAKSGTLFGGDISFIYLGKCERFDDHLKRWGDWEEEYVRRGYRTVSLDDFINAGGYGKKIDHLLSIKRNQGEEPLFHAKIYVRKYPNEINPEVNLSKLLIDRNTQYGTYELPSTEK